MPGRGLATLSLQASASEEENAPLTACEWMHFLRKWSTETLAANRLRLLSDKGDVYSTVPMPVSGRLLVLS